MNEMPPFSKPGPQMSEQADKKQDTRTQKKITALNTLKQQCIAKWKKIAVLIIVAVLVAVCAFAAGRYSSSYTVLPFRRHVVEPTFPFDGQRDPEEIRQDVLDGRISFH